MQWVIDKTTNSQMVEANVEHVPLTKAEAAIEVSAKVVAEVGLDVNVENK